MSSCPVELFCEETLLPPPQSMSNTLMVRFAIFRTSDIRDYIYLLASGGCSPKRPILKETFELKESPQNLLQVKSKGLAT